ncbi:MAG: hypothetical protein KJ970_13175 [Candidatus Eisenbacteria bacterium]|uniref:Uncharacterized protein n=1 Tax=Eiseniibacteriota bacterium TaxID=2212470 RepID=A0A948RWN5_UNCEI|nr:hypothetical protein [Candidatus Eisenbacteria bacterium]MBU1949957.1 hypothetical protein [Candidatus Eisenbacteria bacterium]MBU2691866.1 hypothetical protein [Candidatus Eisenbacteria bacterium]
MDEEIPGAHSAPTKPLDYIVSDEPRINVLKLQFNEDMSKYESDGDAPPAGEMQLAFRPMNGKDERVISDMMVTGGRKGKQKYQPGKVMREKAVRSNVWIKGVRDSSGNTESKLTYDLYDRFESWIITAIADHITKINEYDEDDEEE